MASSLASLGNLNRLREIVTVLARHGFGQVLERGRVFQALGYRPKETPEAPPATVAQRLKLVLAELGPTFVKLGQVLSTRGDLLPQEMIRELSGLQDKVPPFPFAQVREQVEKGLGRTLEDAFSRFEEEPLASASIAQVHRATTKAGIDVIVKVQRPGIRSRIEADLELVYALASLFEKVFEEPRLARPRDVVEEFDKAIKGELDFTREAANVNLFRKVHAERPYVVVPHVLEQFSCSTVLTLERLDGPKITDYDPEKHDRTVITKNLVELAFVQMFEDGLFHGDPHPGNLLALDGNRVGLIDLGLIGRLSRPMQETIIVMCLAISLKDAGTLARLLYKIGVTEDRVSLAQMQSDIQVILDQYLGTDLAGIDAKSLLGDMLDLANRYRIRIPREYAVLAKASVTIEGVVRRLCPELDVLAMALPYAQRLLVDRFNPASTDASARRLLLQAQGFANDVPGQLAQVLMDLERGKLNVTLRGAETHLSELVAAARLLAISLMCGTVGIGGFLLTGRQGLPVWLGPSVVGLALSVFGGAFAWLVLGLRPRKIRLKR